MKLELIEYVKVNLPAGFLPYSIYSIIIEEKEVGRIILREGSDQECYYDGHIGYHIDEEYRGCLLYTSFILQEVHSMEL